MHFDEMFGVEAWRVFDNSTLKVANIKSHESSLLSTYPTGEGVLLHGRTGEAISHPITVGKTYILKLVHLADEKLHAAWTGP